MPPRCRTVCSSVWISRIVEVEFAYSAAVLGTLLEDEERPLANTVASQPRRGGASVRVQALTISLIEQRLEASIDHAFAVERHLVWLHAGIVHHFIPGGVADLL